MKMIFRYMRVYWTSIALVMALKLVSAFTELMLPYILEHMIDNVVPQENIWLICLWGALMVVASVATWQLNVRSNRKAVNSSFNVNIKNRIIKKSKPYNGAHGHRYTHFIKI